MYATTYCTRIVLYPLVGEGQPNFAIDAKPLKQIYLYSLIMMTHTTSEGGKPAYIISKLRLRVADYM